MTGGIRAPPVDAAASTPAANLPENPERFIIGIVITPIETVLATADPDIEPIKPEPITDTSPAPPVKRRVINCATCTIKSPAPDFSRKEPKIMNINTKVEEIWAVSPNMPSLVK